MAKKKPSLVAESNRREHLRQMEAEQKAIQSRNRRIIIVAALVLAVVVVAVFVIVIVQQAGTRAGGTVVPPDATADRTGIAVNAQTQAATATPATTPPHKVAIYLDYQCTYCKDMEDKYGPRLENAAASGQISLEYRTMTILDSKGNDSSQRAAVAAACADTVGSYTAYHDQVFAHQPQVEGTGYTSTQLRNDFAQSAGITGDNLSAFQKCYDDRATQQFVQGVTDAGMKAGVNGTPIVEVDGQKTSDYESALQAVLLQATAPAATPSATPSASPATPSATPAK